MYTTTHLRKLLKFPKYGLHIVAKDQTFERSTSLRTKNDRLPRRMIHKRKNRKHVLNINFFETSKKIVMNKFAKNFVILILINYAHLCFILEFHNHM